MQQHVHEQTHISEEDECSADVLCQVNAHERYVCTDKCAIENDAFHKDSKVLLDFHSDSKLVDAFDIVSNVFITSNLHKDQPIPLKISDDKEQIYKAAYDDIRFHQQIYESSLPICHAQSEPIE